MDEVQVLKRKVEEQDKIIRGLERILKLSEEEIDNADTIIEMYERIYDFAREEIRAMHEAAGAREIVSEFGRDELKEALDKIHSLDEANKTLKAEINEIKG